jgi:hypothetical protein
MPNACRAHRPPDAYVVERPDWHATVGVSWGPGQTLVSATTTLRRGVTYRRLMRSGLSVAVVRPAYFVIFPGRRGAVCRPLASPARRLEIGVLRLRRRPVASDPARLGPTGAASGIACCSPRRDRPLCFLPLFFAHDFQTLLVVFVAINLCHGR